MKNFISIKLSIATIVLCSFFSMHAQNTQPIKEISGTVMDEESKDKLVFTDIIVDGTNISTVTNSDGEFLLKIPPFLNY